MVLTLSFFYRKEKKTAKSSQRHAANVETPLNLYLGFRLFSERCKDLITALNNLQLCPSYQRIQTLSNQVGNLIIDSFDSHQAAVGSKFSFGQFTSGALDNLDHNPSSSTAYGSFHGSAISLTQHPHDISNQNEIKCSSIKEDTPKHLKELPTFYNGIQSIDYSNRSASVPKTNLQVSTFLKENMSLLMDGESDWLNHVWENCSSDALCNWSTFYAKQSPSSPSPKCKTSLLPLFQESSTDPSMVYHAMILVKRSTEVLNPTQIPVMTCDQPIYAIAKQLQWSGLDPTISEGRFFVMLGGLHIEKSALKLIGDVLKDSEWSRLLAHAGIFTPGVADKLASVSHIKRTRRSHQITLATLHILKMKAFESREDKTIDFDTLYSSSPFEFATGRCTSKA